MSTKQYKVWCAWAVAAAVISVATAADTAMLNIKLGLWEVTMHPQMSGQMPMSDEEMQKMTPEMRARMQAMMQSMMSKPRIVRECMTPEKRSKGFDLGDSSTDCKTTITTNNASEFAARRQCTATDNTSDSTVDFQIAGSDQMSGNFKSVMTRGGRTMNLSATMEGKWLGADCGNIKDSQVVSGGE